MDAVTTSPAAGAVSRAVPIDIYTRGGRPLPLLTFKDAEAAGRRAYEEATAGAGNGRNAKSQAKARRQEAERLRQCVKASDRLHGLVDYLCAGGQLDVVVTAEKMLGGLVDASAAIRYVRSHGVAKAAVEEFIGAQAPRAIAR